MQIEVAIIHKIKKGKKVHLPHLSPVSKNSFDRAIRANNDSPKPM